ncbi:hypothetical protein V5735_04800 (plasmid) [Haladaptatus sp. SPP-AMP-3]|uniref:hypothetical protein n=1 Tax=Haladaptatus sp. SPP-AMP-3 TaxID=3121295 RepID=UPI003C2F512C
MTQRLQQPETQELDVGQQSQSQRYRPMGQQYQQGTRQPQTEQSERQPSRQPMQQQHRQPMQQQPMQQQPTRQQPMQQQPMQQQHRQASQLGQQIRQRYEESVPSEVRIAVDDLEKVSTTAEWAKVKAVQRGLPRVANVCDDIQELAELQKKLIIRQSPVSHTIGQCSVQAIQEGLQELQQHIDEPEVQATIENAKQSLGTIEKGLSALQTTGTQQSGQHGQQVGGEQFGQQTGQRFGQQYGTQETGQGIGSQSMEHLPSQPY